MITFDGRYRLTTEGDRAIGALIEAQAVSVVVDLVGEGGGHGTAHESAEAIRLCLLALHSMARFSEEAVRDVISGMGIGALVALLTMDFCVMSNLLDTYVDNDPNGTHAHPLTHTHSQQYLMLRVFYKVHESTHFLVCARSAGGAGGDRAARVDVGDGREPPHPPAPQQAESGTGRGRRPQRAHS
jgi:hypothetical protein